MAAFVGREFAKGHGEEGAGRGAAAAQRDGVGFACSAQVPQEGERVGVGEGDVLGVGNGQGKAGALEEGGAVPQVGEGGDARRGAAGEGEFGFGERGAQFGQGAKCGEAGEEHAVGFEGHAELDKGAGEVVHPMEREIGDDEVESAGGKGEEFLVGSNGQGAGPGGHRGGEVGGESLNATIAQQGRDDAAAADVQCAGEGSCRVVQPVEQAVGGIAQDVGYVVGGGGGAVTVKADGVSVERGLHGVHVRLAGVAAKALRRVE